MIVATTGVVPLFSAVKGNMFPVPPAASPMPGALFVQEYVVVPPVDVVPKVIWVVDKPLQTS